MSILTGLIVGETVRADVQPLDEVPQERVARLTKGINFSHWFAQVYDSQGYTKQHFDSYITAADVDLIEQLGFRHVRLSVEPEPMIDWDHPGKLDPAYLSYLDEAIDMILARGLAVIVDIHPDVKFNRQLGREEAHRNAFVHYWTELARHLSARDPDMLFLEVLNEPLLDAGRWLPLQEQLIETIRQQAPQHTIIATGPEWSGVEDLLQISPVDDGNVVYNFHFYEPGLFTHQGATWGWHTWEHSQGTPYPLTSEMIEPVLPQIEHEATRDELIHHASEGWDADRLGTALASAAEWAQIHGVRITCNEFGVRRRDTDPAHRADWLRDVVAACERYDIGWTMWDYAGQFALVTEVNGTREADRKTVEALGLSFPGGSERTDGRD